MMWRGLVVVCVVVVRMLNLVLGQVLKSLVEMMAQESRGIAMAKWRAVLLCCTLALIELRRR